MGEEGRVEMMAHRPIALPALGVEAAFPLPFFQLLSPPLSFLLPVLLSAGLECGQLYLSLVRIATNRPNEAAIPLNPLRRKLRRSVDSMVINKRLSFTFG